MEKVMFYNWLTLVSSVFLPMLYKVLSVEVGGLSNSFEERENRYILIVLTAELFTNLC